MSLRMGQLSSLLFIIACVAAAACKTPPTPLTPDSSASDDPKVEAAYRKGRRQFENEKFGLADETFARILREHPTDPLARSATIMRARVALELGNPKRSRELLQNLKGDQDAVAERAMLYDGVAMVALGEYRDAVKQLKPFEGRLTDAEDKISLYGALWVASKNINKPEQAIVYLDRFLANSVGDETRQSALDELGDMLRGFQSVRGLAQLTEQLTVGGAVWRQVLKRLADIHLEAGRFNESAALLESLEKGNAPELSPERFSSVVEREQYPMRSDTIGLIAPLSNRSRLVGETVVKGVMLGAKEYGLKVEVRDSAAGEPMEDVVEKLVTESGVAAIIGPVDGQTSKMAARSAESLGVPMLLLSPGEGLPSISAYVFREFMKYETEVVALVAIAKSLGYRKFAVLHPDNGYGHLMTRLFRKELETYQLELVREIEYPSATRVFSSFAKSLKDESFEVLFVPESSSTLALIAPALAAAGLWSSRGGNGVDLETAQPIQLLVPSVGFSKDLIRRAGRYLDGTFFSSFFYVTDELPGAARFSERFHLEYGAEPNYLAAYGFDAAAIVGAALKAGNQNRADIRRWLLEVSSRNFDVESLATPFGGFTIDGEPKSLPWIFQVQDSEIVLIRR